MKVKSKRKFQWIVGLLCLTVWLLGGMTLNVQAVTQQGKYSDDITYTLNNGVLTVSGKGELRDGKVSFANRTDIRKIVIQKGITAIGESVFSDCHNVSAVEMADSVTYIGKDAFWGCRNLSTLKLSNALTEIDDYAFGNAVHLGELHLPEGVVAIGEEAFNGCQQLQRMDMPKTIQTIGDFAFYDCSVLSEVQYSGTKNDWQKIHFGAYNDSLINAKIRYGVTNQLTNQSTLSVNTLVKGESVWVTAQASGGSGSYQYAVFYKKADAAKWTTVQAYRTTHRIAVQPLRTGDYNICVKVKDSLGTIAKKYWTVTVHPEPLQNTSTLSAEHIVKGETVTVQASARGGSGANQYAVFYKKSISKQWTTVQSYRTNRQIKVKPLHSGQYDICVKVKDSSGTIVKKYWTVSVQ